MEHARIPRPGDIYRHYKDKLYQIIALAEHTESNELLVVYQALYGDFRTYARPLESFISPLDGEKYPEARQKYRFELVRAAEKIADMLSEEDRASEAEGPDRGTAAAIAEAAAYTAPPEAEDRVVQGVKAGRAAELAEKVESLEKLEKTSSRLQPNAGQDGRQVPTNEQAGAVLLKFLEADSYSEKLDVVYSGKKNITDRIINDMAVALDCTIEDGPLEKRIDSLISCLQALSRFEKKRLR